MMQKKKNFFEEFSEFAMKGNVIDLAVGVIIGAAFSAITTSLVNDVVMPLASVVLGGLDFSKWVFTIGPLFEGKDPSVINIGSFVHAVVNFLILAFTIFLFVRILNKARARRDEQKKALAEPAQPAPEEPKAPTETELLAEILNAIKAKES